MKHTTGDRPKHRTKADKLENLFHTLLLDLGSRIADNEINIKNATNFKYKYESIFLEIIENNVDLADVSNRRELLIAFLDDINARSYEHIKTDEGKVDAFISNL